MLATAKKIELTADTKEEVEELIVAYEAVLEKDPDNIYALWKVGNYNILMGAGTRPPQSRQSLSMECVFPEAVKGIIGEGGGDI